MKLSQRLRDEKAFVEHLLGDSVICPKCNATLGTYAQVCAADLQDPCPGFMAVEMAMKQFAISKKKVPA